MSILLNVLEYISLGIGIIAVIVIIWGVRFVRSGARGVIQTPCQG